jgi:hypothetical protein
MNDSVNKRPRYFDGQYLQDVDFQTEQNYHIDRQRRFARLLTVSGIAEGLTCEASVSNGGSAGIELQGTSIEDIFFTVRKGTAIDAQGRQIVLLQDRINIQIKEDSSGDKILYIKYSDAPSSEDMQGSNETRVTEEPEIGFVDNIDNDNGTHIPLAKVAIQDRKFGGLDFKIREYSGISLPTPSASPNGDNQTSVTLRSVNNQEYTRLVELAGSLSITGNVGIGSLPGSEQLRVQGDSAITGSLSVAQATTLTGNVGIGGAPGNEQLKVQGNSAITGSLAVAATTTLAGNVAVATTNPKIHLAIGDDDTGLNQEADGELAVYSNNQKRIVIKRDGRVGIGTSSPQSRLSVLGNAAIGSKFANEHSAPTDGLIVEGKLGVGTAVPKSNLSVLGSAAIGYGYANQHSAPANGLIIEGNVGIGTHNPSIHLAIGDNDTGLKQIGDGELAVCSNSHQRITIKKNGKVGIITADPKSTLSIYGEAAIGEAYSNQTIAPSNGLLVQGNVGIGTNAPQSKLDVHGSTKMSGSLSVGGYIIKIGNADNHLAIQTLNKSSETRIAMLGGAWGDNIYFYWKFNSTVYGVAIRGKRMTPNDRDPRYI